MFEAARLLLDWRKVPGVVLCIVLPQCDDLVKCEKWDALEEDVELDLKKNCENTDIKFKEAHIFSSQIPPILVKCEKWDELDVEL